MTEINVVAAVLAVLLLVITFVAVWLHGYKKGVAEMEDFFSEIQIEVFELEQQEQEGDEDK